MKDLIAIACCIIFAVLVTPIFLWFMAHVIGPYYSWWLGVWQ
jgi:hypothetical protein